MVLRDELITKLAGSDEPLYTSQKVEPIVQPVQKTFQPLSPVEVEILEHRDKIIPVNEQIATGNNLTVPQTIIPTKLVVVPSTQPTTPVIKIDVEKLIKTYPADTATSIVNDIKENNPLPPRIAEQLVTSNIVQETKVVEEIKEEIVSPAPVKKKKKGFFDGLTDIVYNFIYRPINKK